MGIPKVFGEGEFSGIDYDYSIKSLNKAMKEICSPYFIDLHGENFLDEHFYDGAHTTPSGSKLIGSKIFKYMMDNNILQRTD